ncbi:TRAP transporter small permease [Jannaschia marina]|uniref:TRAP transporter small permease n=1 Tax=Jannaschia marina TaxID=2741674 RepID=UPI0015C7F6DC|nr:TRAP transporter small permease [Jannaschia marina]
MARIGIWIRRLENLVSFSALTVLVLAVFWGVLTRYITERPAVWTTELSGIMFTWVVFVGAMTAFRDGRHIRVTLLVDFLPEIPRRVARKVADLLVVGFLGYATYLSVLMMQAGATRPSPVLDIPFSWVYLATVLAFAGMTVTAMLRFAGALSGAPKGEREGPL